MWTPVYFIRYAEFPIHVEGVTVPNSDGSFDIYINPGMCEEKQAETIQHEIQHIRADHFYDDIKPIVQIEAHADSGSQRGDSEFSADLFPSLHAVGV